MIVNGKPTRSIWLCDNGESVKIIDQTRLPHEYIIVAMETLEDAASAIFDMQVRGAPLIGATAAYGMALAMRGDASDAGLENAFKVLYATRPTAVNLRWALDDLKALLSPLPVAKRGVVAYARAAEICDEDVTTCRSIGYHGVRLIRDAWNKVGRSRPVNILTHCNAGWLAFADWGSATSPIYTANREGLPIHVWVDETRPLNQGSRLTSWELANEGVPHTIIPDNTGGHLMSSGLVDVVITGTDRTTSYGDVANKIGTYLKALAAKDNDIPFYVALPSSTFDWDAEEGGHDIPIEQRDPKEVMFIEGITEEGNLESVAPSLLSAKYANYAFDITPSRLITGLITERGICTADRDGIMDRFPERRIK